ncbi:MAG: ATP-binding protein [Candidatus Izemoplasmataceae bacterium]
MRKILALYAKLSLATQIIITIILVFITFFILQLFLNSVFFRNYYIDREIQSFEVELDNYVDTMLSSSSNQYFDIMYDFTRTSNAYSVILDQNFRISSYQYSEYSIHVFDDETSVTYRLLILDNDYNYQVGDAVQGIVVQSIDSFYTIRTLVVNGNVYYNQTCFQDCIEFNGEIVEVNKPSNLNYLFEQSPLVQSEIRHISSNSIILNNYSYERGFKYQTSDGPVDSMVFIQPLGDWNYIMTVIQIQDTQNIIGIVSSYQNYVYLTAVVIIVLWSFRIGNTASNPIKNIERTARQIANLNFDVSADEYKNKETTSLSNSINLIAKNLNSTIDTINKKNAELIALYKEQTEQTNLKKQLVSSISHELKTPLMIMQVTVQGILDGIIPSDEVSDELNNLLEEINKSSMMIQDLLQIYRLEDNENPLDLESVNLGETVEFFVNDFSNIIKKYNFNVELDLEKNLFIHADYKLIKRAISNFITNAIKYTPEGETISIKVYKTNNDAIFEIINTGIEIESNHLKSIWMPFYTIESTHNDQVRSKGSGIGLFLVSHILKAHNYTFGVTNIKNGVRAHFKAPISKDI